jgi:D-alanyl-lipoteichoic acid acyltransferase DltB (MBOAT superfamily)
MLFNSYLFILVFLPVTLGVYVFIVRQGWRKQSFDWLVVASIFFYGWWKWSNIPLLLGSLLFNYTIGTWLGKLSPGRRAKVLLVFGLTGNLVFLGYFKYANFFIDNADALLGLDWGLTHVVLPLGISFITFQKIAYLVDSYHGLTRGYGFRDFCLFVSFFPQLIAGPIVHHSELMPQFRRPNTGPDWEDWGVGATLFVIGLGKKVLVADPFAAFATPVFNAAHNGVTPTFAVAWIGTLAYTMQIYFDFSGYSDMATGLGRLFGIRLPLNFNSPYKAVNIADFWRRWHMTLSRFLRDYLYIPLGGNRKGPCRRYVNLLLTMLLGGLWHGAGWTFVAWGGLHGLYLSIFHGWHDWRARTGRTPATPSAGGVWVGRVATFFLVLLAWVFFRAESFRSAITILGSMAGIHGFIFRAELVNINLTEATKMLALFLGVVWLFPNSHEVLAAHQPALEYAHNPPRVSLAPTPRWLSRWLTWQPNLLWALVLAALMVSGVINLSRPTEFIYWQF